MFFQCNKKILIWFFHDFLLKSYFFTNIESNALLLEGLLRLLLAMIFFKKAECSRLTSVSTQVWRLWCFWWLIFRALHETLILHQVSRWSQKTLTLPSLSFWCWNMNKIDLIKEQIRDLTKFWYSCFILKEWQSQS